MSEVFGPTFEEASDSAAIPAVQSCYATVTGGEFHETNGFRADGSPYTNYSIQLEMTIKGHAEPAYDGWKSLVWLSMSGRSAWRLRRMASQCSLDYIQSQFDTSHPDYVGADARPVFNSGGKEVWNKICDFYLSGRLIDDNDQEYESDMGGLLNKTVEISIGKPRKDKDGIDRTGNITPVKITTELVESGNAL